MPKTKSAFAFCDFDKLHILQRLGLGIGTDEEILSALKISSAENTIEKMESKLRRIQNLRVRLEKYHKLIVRHKLRWKRIENYYHEKLNLPDSDVISLAPAEYEIADIAVFELQKRIIAIFSEVDETIQKRYRQNLAARLRQYRKKAKLSQQELGDLVFMSQRAISNFDTGSRDISTPTLIRLARALNVSVDELLGIK